MATIQMVVDDDLLKSADRTAKRLKINRSALLRRALRDYLRKLAHREQELRDRQGYERFPDTQEGEAGIWERAAEWPRE